MDMPVFSKFINATSTTHLPWFHVLCTPAGCMALDGDQLPANARLASMGEPLSFTFNATGFSVLYACEAGRGRLQSVNGLQMDKLPQSASQLLATWQRRSVLLQRTLQVFDPYDSILLLQYRLQSTVEDASVYCLTGVHDQEQLSPVSTSRVDGPC